MKQAMKPHLLAVLLLLAAAAPAPGAMAQTPTPTPTQSPAPPPLRCVDKVHRQFDFWLGEWEVFSPKGDKIGENSVTAHEKGCLILERWTSARGVTGQSYNFYDEDRKQWRQVWVSPYALTDYAGALDARGQMVMEGVMQGAGDTRGRSLGTWTANADGTVTQTFQAWDEEKKAWKDDFVGVYRRKR